MRWLLLLLLPAEAAEMPLRFLCPKPNKLSRFSYAQQKKGRSDVSIINSESKAQLFWHTHAEGVERGIEWKREKRERERAACIYPK